MTIYDNRVLLSTNRVNPYGTPAADPAPFGTSWSGTRFSPRFSRRRRFHGEKRVRYRSWLAGVGGWIAAKAVRPVPTAADTTEPAVWLKIPATAGSRVGTKTIAPATSPA